MPTGRTFMVPANHNVTGTCGKCGGPIIQPMMWAGTMPADEWCADCNTRPKKRIAETWGPVREMEQA